MTVIHKLLVNALLPGADEMERNRLEVEHHWPNTVPHGCACREKIL